MAEDTKRDLVLAPGQHAHIQDNTKGSIRTLVGPMVITQSQQDVPVRYDHKAKTFVRCSTLEEARQLNVVVVEGSYVVLQNPAKNGLHPEAGRAQESTTLDIGRKIVIPGPVTFPLWPGENPRVIRGHHLRSNQFLLLRVYNEEQAKKNWSQAVMKPAIGTEGEDQKKVSALPIPEVLTEGKHLIIRGTDTSFYIPPTGITVVKNSAEDTAATGEEFVREALTLERLEYAIALDEDGNKRYCKGPDVAFLESTERFLEFKDEAGNMTRKSRAIELNPLQGIHVKVITDFTDTLPDGKKVALKAGDERFITGNEYAIYYPREEEAAVKYDGKVKTFAVAVPKGEGRYVMDRMKGNIEMVRGSTMLLPDPRTKIIVQRALSDRQCALWYPGNMEVAEFNKLLQATAKSLPTTRSAPSSEDMKRGKFGDKMKSGGAESYMISNTVGDSLPSGNFGDNSRVSKEQPFAGDEFNRQATFTTPRTLTLNTKLHGVPSIDIWAGYAVMVVNKAGDRRVVAGPATLLLEYDEVLSILTLSTGKPKNTDKLFETVFLRTENNQVSDVISVETSDHIILNLKLVYQVDFLGDTAEEQEKWFSVENYTKLLCDHARSVLKGSVRKHKVEDFYKNSTEIIRNTILSPPGLEDEDSGMLFVANNMRVKDVEVLGVTILDEGISKLLSATQLNVVRSNIELADLQRTFEVRKAQEDMKRDDALMVAESTKVKNEVEKDLAVSSLELAMLRYANKQSELLKQKILAKEEQELQSISFEASLGRRNQDALQEVELTTMKQNLEVQLLKEQTEAAVARFQAMSGGFGEALTTLSTHEVMTKVAHALSLQTAIGGGDNLVSSLRSMFKDIPLLASVVDRMSSAPANGASRSPSLPASS